MMGLVEFSGFGAKISGFNDEIFARCAAKVAKFTPKRRCSQLGSASKTTPPSAFRATQTHVFLLPVAKNHEKMRQAHNTRSEKTIRPVCAATPTP